MPLKFCVTVAFLDRTFHGRGDGDEPEWPPSPLRLFQALLAVAASGRRDDAEFEADFGPAFRFLEGLAPPTIVAPAVRRGAPYRLSVPNNAMDVAAKAWVRGNVDGDGDANPATHRAMKTVQPQRLDTEEVHYLWDLPESADGDRVLLETLCALGNGLVALGWGIDLVAGRARLVTADEAAELAGDRRYPAETSPDRLRVPTHGTLESLRKRYRAHLDRISAESRPKGASGQRKLRPGSRRSATDGRPIGRCPPLPASC